MKKLFFYTMQKNLVVISLFLFITTLQAEPRKIQFWHSMSGALEEKLAKVVAQFNTSQKDVFVEAFYKGNYTDALNGVVAAYRGGKQPHIAQIFEVGTQTMMTSGAIIPVEELFQNLNIPLNKSDFLEPVSGYYSQRDGKLMSLPFNSSSPIVYYNKDMLQKAGITKIPETWDEMHDFTRSFHEKTGICGLVFGWQSWTLVENFLAINNIPIANPENGFLGFDLKMNLSDPDLMQNIARIAEGVQKKEYRFEGRRSEAPRRAFLAKKCAFLIDSSSSIGTLKKQASFAWGTTFQPYLKGRAPQNSLIGGASLWALKGHSPEDNKAVAQFFQFLLLPDVVASWHQATGYIPVTLSAYKKSQSDGYYQKDPNQETAVKQLLRGIVNANSRGIRLGNFSQVREVIEENLEQIWEGRRSVKEGLEEANTRANLVLSRFAKLRQGATTP